MGTWQGLMVKGNECFSAKLWSDAEYYYDQAIDILDGMLHQNPKSIEAIQGWICGYHNLSTLFQKTGEIARAQKCLLIPHQSMMHMAQREDIDDDQQLIAIQATKLTLTPLLEFAQTYPTCEGCVDMLMDQYRAAYQDNRTFH
ncbi:hypothetical protein C2869_06560 [Saccharobesus litoralis]|uniref:Tetratricopeptide repeat protein n=1 Tax=Saccharobesus litoralis TaxID=2172099 RepID=A0A2S0VPK7_9ALTE|nr:hypothetical protein [Saccharobesus litoralis]AWB66122.1 hypothetical protein C2869_06560 [Saccharobesus litoralis]